MTSRNACEKSVLEDEKAKLVRAAHLEYEAAERTKLAKEPILSKVTNAFVSSYYFSLLSGVATAYNNLISGPAQVLLNRAETAVASGIGGIMSLKIGTNPVPPSVALAELHGVGSGLIAVARTMKALGGTPENLEIALLKEHFPPELAQMVKYAEARQALHPDVWGVEQKFGAALLNYSNAVLNSTSTVLFRTDIIPKMLEVRAQEFGIQQMARLAGKSPEDALAQVRQNPKVLIDAAHKVTYTSQPTPLASDLIEVAHASLVGRLLSPMMRIGSVILDNYIERLPGVGVVMPKSRRVISADEITGQSTRAHLALGPSQFSQDMHSGDPVKQARAASKQVTAVGIAFGLLAAFGPHIRGEKYDKDAVARQMDEQSETPSSSFQALGTTWKFKGLGVPGMIMSTTATLHDLIANADYSNKNDMDIVTHAMGSYIEAITLSIADANYLKNITDLIASMSNVSISEYAEEKLPLQRPKSPWKHAIQTLVDLGLTPLRPGVVRDITKMIDPSVSDTTERDIEGGWNETTMSWKKVMATYPAYKARLTSKIDLFGNPWVGTVALPFIGNINPSHPSKDPLVQEANREIKRLHIRVGKLDDVIDDTPLTSAEYEYYCIAAGKGDVSRPGNKTLAEAIHDITAQSAYQTVSSPASQEAEIVAEIHRYRDQAKWIVRDLPDFAQRAETIRQAKADLFRPQQ